MDTSATSSSSDGKMLGGLLVFGAIVLGCMSVLLFQSNRFVRPSSQSWSLRIERALKNGTGEALYKELSKAIETNHDEAQLYLDRGSLGFRLGKIDASVADFDKCIELQPDIKPHLWQRGISLYYAGKFELGKEQFEVHRTVNPNDVENAFWHFLCAAKIDGVDAASKDILLSGLDRREPLMQVQKMIAGKASMQEVLDITEKGSPSVQFYGFLYLGLFADAKGNEEDCKKFLKRCLDVEFPGYMHDVAKVHLELLERNSKKSNTEKPNTKN